MAVYGGARGGGGFGLNYEQGFRPMGSGFGYAAGFGGGGGAGGAGMGGAWDLYRQGKQQQFQGGLERELLGTREAGDTARARIAAEASMYPATLKQQRFGTLLPALQGMGSQNAFGGTLGTEGPGPEISVGPVWTPQQIQQQVNAARSFNTASAQNAQQKIAGDVAGRGFGANSPLAMALQSGQAMQNLIANSEAARQIRWDAAQGNVSQLLKSQQAREAQYANRQAEDIERRKGSNQFQSALMAAMASLA